MTAPIGEPSTSPSAQTAPHDPWPFSAEPRTPMHEGLADEEQRRARRHRVLRVLTLGIVR